jgi:L-alanine-DL-glutamate epimerase-like enolase superfamily enzyme
VKVQSVQAFQVRIPLRKAIRHASHSRTDTENLVIRCTLADGTVGWGEGVPRDYVTGETIADAISLLRASDPLAQLGPANDLAAAIEQARRFTIAPTPGDDRRIRGNSARCAVELAYLDATCRHLNLPFGAIVPLVVPELHRPQPEVRYSGAITSAKGWKLVLAAWIMWGYGFRQVKLKVGIAGYDDLARLKSLRRRVGKLMDLRIDANEAWSPADTVARITALEPFGITSVEQPIPHEQVAALRDIRKQIKTPIMLDESLCGIVDAEVAIADGLCDLFNLRLSKCGGIIPTLELAALAHRAGLGYQLGCQVGETAILSAAGRHVACNLDRIRYLEGSYDRHLVREALATTDLTFGRGGKAQALPGPGLGITIDPAALKRVTVHEVAL